MISSKKLLTKSREKNSEYENIITQLEKLKLQQNSPKINNECCVCFEKIKKRVALVPCGHTNICVACIEKLSEKKCPMCNSNFSHNIHIFI